MEKLTRAGEKVLAFYGAELVLSATPWMQFLAAERGGNEAGDRAAQHRPGHGGV
jgi:hypothetical protein